MAAKLARSGKLNETTRAVILAAVASGMTLQTCAEMASVSRMSLYRWLRQGDADVAAGRETELARFATEFREAESSFIGRVEMATGQSALKGNPKAMALVLKARRPEVYASSAPALKAEVVEQLFAHLRDRLPPETYQQVIQACESFTEPKSLGPDGARE